MGKVYLAEKKKKKKSAMKGVVVLVFAAIAFVAIVIKFALTGSVEDVFTGAPSSTDVYEIAKDFVRPTLKSPDATFSDSAFQFGQTQDSVYVIKSFVETPDGTGSNQRTNFEITLKYKGGLRTEERNWEVLNLNEE